LPRKPIDQQQYDAAGLRLSKGSTSVVLVGFPYHQVTDVKTNMKYHQGKNFT
jgi:hypothetical protein